MVHIPFNESQFLKSIESSADGSAGISCLAGHIVRECQRRCGRLPCIEDKQVYRMNDSFVRASQYFPQQSSRCHLQVAGAESNGLAGL